MAATLPALTLECSGCGHRWPTRARAGSSIRCPRCRRVRRVAADRPRTEGQARAAAAAHGADDGLSAAWEAERPYEPDWRKIPGADSGRPCSKCGQPMRWAGAHTGLLCARCRVWAVSPGARDRAAEHLAAIDNSAARRSAQLADPAAERAAAEALASDRAELLDDLDGLAELLDVSDFPRAEPHTAARKAGVRLGAVVEQYKDRARRADTLDQLARVAADAEAFAARTGGWLDRIADLRDGLDQADDHDVIRGRVEYDDDDWPDPDDAQPPPLRPGQRSGTRAMLAAAHIPPAIARAVAAEQYGPFCGRCRTRQRRDRSGRFYRAVARAELPGQPFEDLCADHLTEARERASAAGLALHVSERFDSPSFQQWAAYDAASQAQAVAIALRGQREAGR
jgi:hypothetical protein